MFFVVKNNVVFLVDKYKDLPEIKSLMNGLPSKKHVQSAFDYLHFCYSRTSPYYNLLLSEKKMQVCKDRYDNEKLWEKIEENKYVSAVIDLMIERQFNDLEKLLLGAKEKIDEYVQFWQRIKITEENYRKIEQMTKGAEDLMKLRKRLENEVSDYNSKNGIIAPEDDDTKLFELPERGQ